MQPRTSRDSNSGAFDFEWKMEGTMCRFEDLFGRCHQHQRASDEQFVLLWLAEAELYSSSITFFVIKGVRFLNLKKCKPRNRGLAYLRKKQIPQSPNQFVTEEKTRNSTQNFTKSAGSYSLKSAQISLTFTEIRKKPASD